MSVGGALGVLVVAIVIYVAVIFSSRAYNHGGRDPINPLYSISQWDPGRVELIKTCVVPSFPGKCVIEGMTGAYQEATHWCNVSPAGPCIDPDTGANVKSNPIPFQVVCSEVPYCNWSQCSLKFDDNAYLSVQISPTGTTLTNVPNMTQATVFYMERLIVGDNGLTKYQNGTIARFYFQPQGSTDTYLLSYTNNYILPQTTDPITSLTIQLSTNTSGDLLTMFVLMEAMPTTVAFSLGAPLSGIVAKKILGFGGFNRKSDPRIEELIDFNDHVQAKMWGNALKYDLILIRWHTEDVPAGFYGIPQETYVKVLNGWSKNSPYALAQDIVEYRLLAEPGGASRAFYNWIG